MFVRTHAVTRPLRELTGFAMFNEKEDDCLKVVLTP